ncbi:MAG: hypothetical protein RLY20_1305, partial [Verrucomicrobiota bacterium]
HSAGVHTRKTFIPYNHSTEPQHKLFIIRGTGAESIAEIEESTGAAAADFIDGKARRDFGVLIDVNAIAIQISYEDAGRIESCVRMLQSCTSGPIAIVTSAVAHAVPANIIAMNTEVNNRLVQVFYDETAAREWLKRHLH